MYRSQTTSFQRTFFVALLIWLVCSGLIHAQKTTDPERFEKDILAFEAADQKSPPPKNPTLFVGASNIRRWSSLAQDFRGVPVMNRGFGGALIRDVLHYADRIILPYEPKAIVLQAGGNDLNGGRSPEDVVADFKTLVAKIHTKLPMTTITVLSTPPSEARWSQAAAIRSANEQIRQYTSTDSRILFIDLFETMLTADGRPRAELFVDDKLHVNAQGYELWTSLIRWEKEVRALEESDRKASPAPGGIVFVGSSSIKRWTSLATDFPDHHVINHGFGGSQVADSVLFAPRIITPLKPRLVVFYAGGNDINAGKKADRVLADAQALVRKIHGAAPETRIALISIAGNPARWAQVEEVKAANKLLEDFTKTDQRLAFINVFPHMLGADGLPKPDIFVADRLHMNPLGYEIWKAQIRPYLE